MGTDNYQAGILAGRALLAALGKKGGKVIGLVGELTAANSVERIQGIKDTLVGSNVVLETVLIDGLDPLKSTSNATTALEQEPDLAAFVGLYSYDAEGAAQALELANKLGTVKIVAFDLEPATIKRLNDGSVSAAIVQRPYYMGYLSSYILDATVTLGPDKTMALLSPFLSGTNKDTIDTGVDMVTPDTLPLYLEYLNSIGVASE
jgi:ribose transport system substrate-binding protein